MFQKYNPFLSILHPSSLSLFPFCLLIMGVVETQTLPIFQQEAFTFLGVKKRRSQNKPPLENYFLPKTKTIESSIFCSFRLCFFNARNRADMIKNKIKNLLH